MLTVTACRAYRRETQTPSQGAMRTFEARYSELTKRIQAAAGDNKRLGALRADVKQLNISLAHGLRKKLTGRINKLYEAIAEAKQSSTQAAKRPPRERLDDKARQQQIARQRALKVAQRALPDAEPAELASAAASSHEKAVTMDEPAAESAAVEKVSYLTEEERAHLEELVSAYELCDEWVDGMLELMENAPRTLQAEGRWSTSLYFYFEQAMLQGVDMSSEEFRADMKRQYQQLTELLTELHPDCAERLAQRAKPLREMHRALCRLPDQIYPKVWG